MDGGAPIGSIRFQRFFCKRYGIRFIVAPPGIVCSMLSLHRAHAQDR
jgi:hypothetical protein